MYRAQKTYRTTLLPFVIVALIFIALWALQPVLSPFIAAAVLAYILQPMQKKMCHWGVRPSLAAMCVMIVSLLLMIALVVLIVPMLMEQMHSLVQKIPHWIHWFQQNALPRINAILRTDYTFDSTFWLQIWEEHSSTVQAAFSKMGSGLIQRSGGLIAFLGNIMLLPFLLYYFLLDWHRWSGMIFRLLPRRWVGETMRIAQQLDEVLGEFLRGQLLVMLVMSLIYALGLSIVGLDNAVAIGVVSGILVFVPYLGAFTGLLLATMAALLQYSTWMGLLPVWAVFALGQLLESFVITPRLVGERIGLSPLAVIFALMAFGHLLGFVGMLLALPMAAICVVLFREGVHRYWASDFYQREK